MSADIRALPVEHPCSDEWGGPDWHCGAEGCNASGCSWEDYADHIAEVAGTCKHCGEAIEDTASGYCTHTSGPYAGRHRCAVEPYGYLAEPLGACSSMCLGASTGVEGRVE